MKKIYISAVFITFLFHFFVTNNSAADTITPYCPSSGNAVIAPAFNQTAGYCVTRPIDLYNTCPDGYTYSMDYKTCVSLPLCPGASIWDASTKQCQAFSPTSSSSSWISIPDNSCAVDLNGNGDVEPNEIFQCTQTPQGYICPQGQVQCNPADGGSITLSGSAVISYNQNLAGTGNKFCNMNNGSCLTFTVLPDKTVSVTGQMSNPGYWTLTGIGNQMVLTQIAPPCDGHYSTGSFVFQIQNNTVAITPITSPLNYIVSGCSLHLVPNGNKIDAYDGPYKGSIIFTYNPPTTYSCPLGNYPCMQVNNQWMCSQNQCITQSQLEDEGDAIPSGLDDDGPRDSDGNCLGTVLIFNGKGMRCRKAGVSTGFHNCCDESKGKLYDSTGSTGIGSMMDATKVMYGVAQATSLGTQLAKTTFIEVQLNGDIVLDGIGNGFHAVLPAGSAEARAVQDIINQGTGVVKNGAVITVTDANAVTGSGMANFLKESGLAGTVVSLATSMAISDPTLSAAVNLAAQSVLWAAGLAGPTAFAAAVLQVGMSLVMANCDTQDIMTSTFDDSDFCHKVGSWCMKKWPAVGCVQKANGYCCFNSKLARIIQEQGRPQLVTFGADGSWGSPKHPNCRGFTPDEFQSLDFDKIDLSEYVQDIQRNIRQNIQGNVQQIFNQSMQQLTR